MSGDYRAALASLRAQDIEELRSYRQPPEQVVWVTDILCSMFGEEPGWESAKQMLSQEDFYQVRPPPLSLSPPRGGEGLWPQGAPFPAQVPTETWPSGEAEG